MASALTGLPSRVLSVAMPRHCHLHSTRTCSGVYKESGFPHEVVSDLTCRKWQVRCVHLAVLCAGQGPRITAVGQPMISGALCACLPAEPPALDEAAAAATHR